MLLAQDVKDTTQIKKNYKNSFTFRGGANIAYRKYHALNLDPEYGKKLDEIEKPGLGYDLGVDYGRRISKLFSYSVGFRFNKFTYCQNEIDGNLHSKFVHETICIPLAVSLYFTKNKSWYSTLFVQPSYVTRVEERLNNPRKFYSLSVIDMTLKDEVILMGGLAIGKNILSYQKFSFSAELSFFNTSTIHVDPEANGETYYNGAYDRSLYGASLSLLFSLKY